MITAISHRASKFITNVRKESIGDIIAGLIMNAITLALALWANTHGISKYFVLFGITVIVTFFKFFIVPFYSRGKLVQATIKSVEFIDDSVFFKSFDYSFGILKFPSKEFSLKREALKINQLEWFPGLPKKYNIQARSIKFPYFSKSQSLYLVNEMYNENVDEIVDKLKSKQPEF